MAYAKVKTGGNKGSKAKKAFKTPAKAKQMKPRRKTPSRPGQFAHGRA